MKLEDIAFGVTDWQQVEPVTHPGERGTAVWCTLQLGALRVRMVEYSPGL
jgi:hypothetical protein